MYWANEGTEESSAPPILLLSALYERFVFPLTSPPTFAIIPLVLTKEGPGET
jgi:hypothetical protein